jgi:uncharacterized sulfatase
MLNRRQFLHTASIASASIISTSSITGFKTPENNKRPNILWLVAEDLSPDIACYGNEIVNTPGIDTLASQGIKFQNAFATCTVCSPSRSAFMTGMYQTTIAAHQHRTVDPKPLPANTKVFSEYLKQAGYFIFNGQFVDAKNTTNPENWTTKKGKNDFNFLYNHDKLFQGTHWRDNKNANPFFGLIQFHETHRTFRRDPENPIDPAKVDIPPYYPDHPITRQDWANYLETVQVLDKKVTHVLKQLNKDGLADNTIVFFFADHGRPHVRDKQFLYDGGIKVPLIIRWPNKIKPGTVNNNLVSLIDLAPTVLKMANVTPPPNIQGIPLFSDSEEKRSHIIAARDRCDETYDRIRCVRTKKYKYIKNFFPNLSYMQPNAYKIRNYPVWTLIKVLYNQGKLTDAQAAFASDFRPPEELYDLKNDPHEINNLAQNPDYKSILTKLRSTLDNWIQKTDDKGQIPEDPTIAAEVYLRRHRPNKIKKMKRAGLSPDIKPLDYLEYWQKKLEID